MDPLFDLGRGNERTALAWQRTALSLTAASALMSRLAFERLGWVALLSAITVPLSVSVMLESRLRHGHGAGIRPRRRPPDGRAPAALAFATTATAATAFLAMLVG